MAILGGLAIKAAVEAGKIRIDPWDPDLLNPVSVDLRLGRMIRIYMCGTTPANAIDCRRKETIGYAGYEMTSVGFLLQPGRLYLMHTVERVWTESFVPVLDGKSSVGRLGIHVHVTAGYGDPGFDGQYTLEVVAHQYVVVYPGMRFCQMRFHEISGAHESYRAMGNYRGELAAGPVPSQVWRQFEKMTDAELDAGMLQSSRPSRPPPEEPLG